MKLDALDADETAEVDFGSDADLTRALAGSSMVFSSIGASIQPAFGAGYRSYTKVDTPVNLTLIRAAKQAKVERFVYVSVYHSTDMRSLDYVKAHENVVDELRSSGLSYAVVRPTGFYSAFTPILSMAAKGSVPLMGDPEARTNPIDDRDLAEVCVRALAEKDFGEQAVGGPETFTRRELLELAFEATGTPVNIKRLPSGFIRFVSACLLPFNPRVAHITRFFLEASSCDCVAPSHGSARLTDFYRETAQTFRQPNSAHQHPGRGAS